MRGPHEWDQARWRERRRAWRQRRRGLRWRLTRLFSFVALAAVMLTSMFVVGNAVHLYRQLEAQTVGAAGGSSLPRTLEDGSVPDVSLEFGDGPARSGGGAARQLFGSALLAALISSFLASGVAFFATRSITRPLTRLAEASQRLERGERGLTLPTPRHDDEVRDLTLAFNGMVASLERQEAWRRAVVADVAHDLRTPLAVMRAELEAMQDGISSPDEAGLGRLHGEVLLLARLVDDLRTLSLAEGGALSLRPELLELGHFLEGVVATFRLRAQAQGVVLELKLPPFRVELTVDRDRLAQVLGNLLDNALRYGAGPVELGLEQVSDEVKVWVRDGGPGLPPQALARAFERFYRADASRTRDPSGRSSSGLGLSIARALVEAQGGTLEAENLESGGARFTLSFRSS